MDFWRLGRYHRAVCSSSPLFSECFSFDMSRVHLSCVHGRIDWGSVHERQSIENKISVPCGGSGIQYIDGYTYIVLNINTGMYFHLWFNVHVGDTFSACECFVVSFSCSHFSTPPLPRDESVVSGDQFISPSVHASLHFIITDWIMTIILPSPRRLSSNSLSQTHHFCW